jgi:hypothetical protein
MGEYVPVAPNSDDARKHNQNLKGMGGVFNYVNFHVYHYGGNNPIKYVDPNGRTDAPSHRKITLEAAGELGLTEDFADKIAKANVRVDGLFSGTHPIVGKDKSAHFNTLNNKTDFKKGGDRSRTTSGTYRDSRNALARGMLFIAVDLYNIGDMDGAAEALGVATHALQDMATHSDGYIEITFGFWSHWPSGMDADRPNDNPDGHTKALDNTKAFLEEFLQLIDNRTTD